MKEVDDGFDIMASVLALILMLSVCAWAVAAMRSSFSAQVVEKATVQNVYGLQAVEPTQTAKDALMSLVVNDAYVPDPASVVFQLGQEAYTVIFDSDYFQDREMSINKAWNEFFHDKMGAAIESTTLDASGTRWIVKLIP